MRFEQLNEQECLSLLLKITAYEDMYEDYDTYKTTRRDVNIRLAQIREAK